jgi:hypothetical protein
MTYDPYWLAIVKVYNPYLSLEIRPKVYPLQDHLDQMVKDEYERILHEGLLVPAQAASQVGQTSEGPTTDSEAAAVTGGETAAEAQAGTDNAEAEAGIKLVWEKGPIEINRVQKFWPTAPCQGQPGGDPSESIPCSDHTSAHFQIADDAQERGIPTPRPRLFAGCSVSRTRSTLRHSDQRLRPATDTAERQPAKSHFCATTHIGHHQMDR